ncbi:MAG TPA: pitrilysin family protein [Hyphomicrobiales bacterium]|nr:pitrilysin family protein [Hyphomicrobiales bacterium]
MTPALRIACRLRPLALGLLVLAALMLRPAAATEVQRVVSPGGIEAWLVEEHAVPVIAMDFGFAGGSAQDPEGKTGLANLLSGLLDEGAGDLDSATFQKALEDNSISMSFSAGRDVFYGSLKTLTANRDEAFRLLTLAVNEPRFDAEPIERMRAQIVAGIKANEKDPEELAFDLWYEAAFPDHPYGWRKEGSEASLAAVTAADLAGLRDRMFARRDLKVAVVGDIDAKTLAPLLDEVFGRLPADPDLVAVPEITPKAGARVESEIANPQTVIRFGGVGIKRDDPDFIPAYIANHILGGGSFSSRLYDEVREKRGLAYSVYTFLAPYDHAGAFVGGVATRSDRAGEAMQLIESELKRFAAEGPTEKELAEAKSFLVGSFALRFDTSQKISAQLLAFNLDNLGIDYINKRNALIEAVTIEDVKRAAKRVFGSGGLIVATVGPLAS